ncbi:hypothetical protein PAA8504_04367 [Palleronia abyssalis]|uniref:Uncharacterized protein n=1 Tax=Palleronia abyssalis TaxID=1501240 RepID=A0A2R8C269_9RHOB|nr:hypothetical protein PAA8504_04367 [Palleronia abyssalis]
MTLLWPETVPPTLGVVSVNVSVPVLAIVYVTVAATPATGEDVNVSVPPSATAPPSDEETPISGAPDGAPLTVPVLPVHV